jgi:acetyltransferase-like isoleucine patch superfamily enzyme
MTQKHPDYPKSRAEAFHNLVAEDEGRAGGMVEKYRRFVVGERGLGFLFLYEILTLVGGLPGAAGFAARRVCYRPLLGSQGRGTIFGRNLTLRHPKKIALGSNVVLDDNVVLDAKGSENHGIVLEDNVLVSRNSIVSCKEGDVRIGPSAKIGINCLIHSESRVEIGAGALVSAYCYILAGGNHRFDRMDLPISEQESYLKGGVAIGEEAWLGARVTVLDGVTIGRGAVIGAGAVVRESVPDFAIAAGVPARIIGMRGKEPGP